MVSRARPRRAGASDRNHLRPGRRAAHLLGRRAHQPHEPRQASGHRHRRRFDGSGDRRGISPLLLESLSVGCVGLSATYFDDGRISEKRFERARTAVRLELEPIQEAYRKMGWLQVFGSSGTVRVIGDVVRRLNPDAPRITLDNLRNLAGKGTSAPATSMNSTCPMSMPSARRCFRAASPSCWRSSKISASTGSAWPKAPCARGCCIAESHMPGINGDQCVQSEVLEGLAPPHHRRWFVELAIPFLGDDPIGSAAAWVITRWSGPRTSPGSPRPKPIPAAWWR